MDTPRSSLWPNRLEWGLIIAFWGILALLSVGQGALEDGAAGLNWDAMTQDLVEYTLWAVATPFILRLTGAFPVVETELSSWLTTARNVALHTAVTLTIAISIDVSEDPLAAMLVSPDDSPVGPIDQIQRLWFMDELIISLIVLMAGFARSYYFQQKARQEEAERLEQRTEALETQLTAARLEALRMQLNPHFLFNTLHAVSTLVDRDPAGVRRMIARLSELLRHVLDEEAPQEVPLSQELEFLDDYFEIQSIRFQGRLDTEVHVSPDLYDAQVPNLILQPLVENAIKHGASQVRGMGRIEVCGCREDDTLVLSVTDNGPGLPEAQEGGLGLRNVRARLRELYGEDQALRLESMEEGGTRAVLHLPYHTSTSLYTASSAQTLTASVPAVDAN